MKVFSLLLFFIVLFHINLYGQKDSYLQVNGSFFSVNKYEFNNSDILTGKENTFKPNFGHPQLILGYRYTEKSAFETGIFYRINMFNFESNNSIGNNLISIDLPNSIGVPLRYRYYFNDFNSNHKYRFSMNAGLITLFQQKVNEKNSLGQTDFSLYQITYIPSTIKTIVLLGEIGISVEKHLSDNISLTLNYNFWIGTNDYVSIDLSFKNKVNNSLSTGYITHNGTNHNLSVGIRYTFLKD